MKTLLISLFIGLVLAAPAAGQPSFEEREHLGRPYLAYFPEGEPRGLVWVFHGRGGSERFAVREGNADIMNALAQSGYALVSPQSTQRNDRRTGLFAGWSHERPGPGVSNPDLESLFELYEALIHEGRFTRSTPVFTHGMSNGGGMASFYGLAAAAAGHPVRAIANYMGPLPAGVAAYVEAGVVPPPLFLVIAGNDGLVIEANQRAAAEWLKARGGLVEIQYLRERPLTPEALIGHGAPADEAEAMVAALIEAGIIDAAGRRLLGAGRNIGREDTRALETALASASASDVAITAFHRAWAVHQMRDDLVADQLAFFGAARSGAYVSSSAPSDR
jgi:dienelactone hydrolase